MWRKPIGLIALVGVLAFIGFSQYADLLRQANPLWIVAIGAFLLAALVPRTAVSLACGALFGAWAGSAYALAAALLAAAITFAAGRWAGREVIAARAPEKVKAIDAWLTRRGLLAVVVVRFLPIAPFGLVGYLYGSSSVRIRDYLLGTLIGATPSAISYSIVGAALLSPQGVNLLTLLPACVGLLVSSVAALHWRRQSTIA